VYQVVTKEEILITGHIKNYEFYFAVFIVGNTEIILGLFDLEDKGSTTLRNVRNYLPIGTAYKRH
jgi:hypothetical protein